MVAVGGDDGEGHGAGEEGDAAGFVFDDVRAVVADDGVGRGGKVRAQRYLVAHGAGHDEEGGFFAG